MGSPTENGHPGIDADVLQHQAGPAVRAEEPLPAGGVADRLKEAAAPSKIAPNSKPEELPQINTPSLTALRELLGAQNVLNTMDMIRLTGLALEPVEYARYETALDRLCGRLKDAYESDELKRLELFVYPQFDRIVMPGIGSHDADEKTATIQSWRAKTSREKTHPDPFASANANRLQESRVVESKVVCLSRAGLLNVKEMKESARRRWAPEPTLQVVTEAAKEALKATNKEGRGRFVLGDPETGMTGAIVYNIKHPDQMTGTGKRLLTSPRLGGVYITITKDPQEEREPAFVPYSWDPSGTRFDVDGFLLIWTEELEAA